MREILTKLTNFGDLSIFLLDIANVALATVSSIFYFSQCQIVNIYPHQNLRHMIPHIINS